MNVCQRAIERFGLVLVCILILLTQQPLDAVNAQEINGPVVTNSDVTGLTLTWTPVGLDVSPLTVDGVQYSRIQMPQTTSSAQPGSPQLPVYSKLVGLPRSGEAKVTVVKMEKAVIPLSLPPLPAPQPVQVSPTDVELSNLTGGGPVAYKTDPAVYSTDAYYPVDDVTLGPPRQMRDRRVAALAIYPVRVNPVARQLELIRLVQIRIDFTQPASPAALSPAQTASDAAAQALSPALLNPEAALWPPAAVPEPDTALKPQAVGDLAAGQTTKLFVDEAGLYRLTRTDLQNAGLPVNSLDPRSLKLSYGYPRQEVAILVEGEADGRFDAGDRLLFYADPKPSRYVAEDVYFLSYGGSLDGLRMAGRSGSPVGLPAGVAWRTAEAEINQEYEPHYQARDGDHWYWAKLTYPFEPTGSYPIDLESPKTVASQAKLKVWLYGDTADGAYNPDHRVNFQVNGNFVGTVEWDGQISYLASLNVPTGYLKAGQNQIGLSLPGISGVFGEGMWLDAISLTYPVSQVSAGQIHFEGETGQKKYTVAGVGTSLLVFDVTDPDRPRQVFNYLLAGNSLTVGDQDSAATSYLIVPTGQLKTPLRLEQAQNLSDPGNGADYIIITPNSLAGAIKPLADYRAAQGLRVTTVDVAAIYDNYGDGRMDPAAIKTYLEHAYFTWPQPAPLYVLLVGDGSYDFRNYSGYNPKNLIPPFMAPVDPWWGETAADNRYVTLVGGDNLPDMLIGRLAVNDPAETTVVVNKILQYEQSPPGDLWNTNHIFVADNPDSAGNFHRMSDLSYDLLPGSFKGRRYYFDKSPGSEPHIYSDPALLRTNLLDSLNAGSSFVTYYGHSSWWQWSVESLLHIDNLEQLTNQDRLPIVSQMTCFTGFFHHPIDTGLDERLLRQSGGGAVAAWGSTGLGVGTGHDKLQEGFYEAIMVDGQATLGTAIMAGKLNLSALGYHRDLLDTFMLFGDPALQLTQIFKSDLRITQQFDGSNYQPGDPITLTLTVQNTGAGVASDITVTNELPEGIVSVQWNPPASGDNGGKTYLWNLPDLAANQIVTITMSGRLDPTLPKDFSLVNKATVSTTVSELSLQNNYSRAVIGGLRSYFPIVTAK